MVTITWVSRDFAGLAWVRYDASFRRHAAITGNKRWSQINPSLYSICFTGCAQVQSRCELCMSAAHSVCLGCGSRSGADQSSCCVLSSSAREWPERPASVEICRLFNENRCRFPKCRYRHVCTKCGESHPAVSCTQGLGPSAPPSSAASRRDAARPY